MIFAFFSAKNCAVLALSTWFGVGLLTFAFFLSFPVTFCTCLASFWTCCFWFWVGYLICGFESANLHGTGPGLCTPGAEEDAVVVEPKAVPAVRFHKLLDFKYCTTNSRMDLYVVRFAKFIAIWGAMPLGANSDKIASFKFWSNCLEKPRSYFAISPSNFSFF